MEHKLVTVLVITWFASSVVGRTACGQSIFSTFAREEQYWNGTAAVIVAEVTDVHLQKGAYAEYTAVFKPRVCVVGSLNPAAQSTLRVEFSAGPMNALHQPPKAGDLVLAVVYDRDKMQSERHGFALANARCMFMPGQQELVVLKGMDDPVILDVLHEFQAARAPTTAPTTQAGKGVGSL